VPNVIIKRRERLRPMLRVRTHEDLHSHLIESAIEEYRQLCIGRGQPLGSVLAVCANYREARSLRKFPFQRILLTSLGPPDGWTLQELANEPRMSYEQRNCECLGLPSRSFDLVFCKEGLHHLARPVLGLYEMLRVARQAVILVEGYDSPVVRLLQAFNIAPRFERGNRINLGHRTNFVFRWSNRSLQSILNSYYLDSGYRLQVKLAWMRISLNASPSWLVRKIAAIGGWFLTTLPLAQGNYMTAIIVPGQDLPADPAPLQPSHEESHTEVCH